VIYVEGVGVVVIGGRFASPAFETVNVTVRVATVSPEVSPKLNIPSGCSGVGNSPPPESSLSCGVCHALHSKKQVNPSAAQSFSTNGTVDLVLSTTNGTPFMRTSLIVKIAL
jgi:hypothetical protein